MRASNFIKKLSALIRLGATEPGILPLVMKIKRENKTFLSYSKLLSLTKAYKLAKGRSKAALQLAEFGVGRGGSAMLLSWLANKYGGTLALFDLFGQIPPPTLADGTEAFQRYEKILRAEDGESYYGNLQDLQTIIQNELAELIKLEQITFVPGKYEDTLPKRDAEECFHLVHIDCDWYESTHAVLTYLQSRLQPGAILQFDDYGFWSGSKKAVDETEWLQDYSRAEIDEALVIDLGHRDHSSVITARTELKS